MRKWKLAAWISIIGVYPSAPLNGQQWTLDPGFIGCDAVNEWQGDLGSFLDVHCYEDGRVLLGGAAIYYDMETQRGLVRLLPNGSVDTSFNVGWDSRQIRAFLVQPDGRVVIAGSFVTWGGYSRPGIARLMPDGSLDQSFDPGQGIGPVDGPNITGLRVLRAQIDGKILVGGGFHAYDGEPVPPLIRLHPNGARDTTFNLSVEGNATVVYDMGQLPSGHIVAVGSVSQLNGMPIRNLVLLDSTGTQDMNTPALRGSRNVLVLPDGRMVVTGLQMTYGGSVVPNMVRLDPLAALDTTFQPVEVDQQITRFHVDAAGRILFGGHFETPANNRILRRLLPDGALDTSFDLTFTEEGLAALFTGMDNFDDGSLFVGVHFYNPNASVRNYLRLSETGAIDTSLSWPTVKKAQVRDILPLPDQRYLVVGSFTRCGSHTTHGSAIIDASGQVDDSYAVPYGGFGVGLHGAANLTNDQVILYGTSKITDNSITSIRRMNPTGALDYSYATDGPVLTPGLPAIVRDVAVYPDGRVLMVGAINEMQNTPVSDIVRALPNGALDTQFTPVVTLPGDPDPELSAMLLLPDERIVVTGAFSTFNGQPRKGLALLDANGALSDALPADLNWHIGCSGSLDCAVKGVLHTASDTLLLWGSFDAYAGTPVGGLVRIGLDGAKDPSFDVGTGANGPIHRVIERSNGTLLVAGSFSTFNGLPAEDLVLLSATGTVLSALEPGNGPAHAINQPGEDPSANAYLLDLIDTPQGVIVVGDFTYLAGQPKQHIARLQNDLLTELQAVAGGAFNVLPNPTADHLQVHSTWVEDVALTTLDGRSVQLGPVVRQGGVLQLDVAHLPPGFYLVHVHDRKGKSGVQRVVKH